MSKLVVPVAEVQNIREHPNADALLLCDILGWQLVIGKDNGYYNGQHIVYVPPDTIVPEYLSDQLHVTQYLSKQRVRAVKLRGEPSYGLTIPIPEGKEWKIDENVADYFGLKKYYPPVRQQAGDAMPEHPLFYRYTEIENLRNYPYVLEDDEDVSITEKIHGMNVRIGMIEGEVLAGSHKLQRKNIENSLFWFPTELPGVKSLLFDLSKHYKQVILYGELFGNKIQPFDYGSPNEPRFQAFDLILDGKYVDFYNFNNIMKQHGVDTVPVLYHGPYSLDVVKKFAQGRTTVGGTNVLEGVVIKPLVERHDAKTGRVIFKYLSDEYLQLKEKKDIDSTDE